MAADRRLERTTGFDLANPVNSMTSNRRTVFLCPEWDGGRHAVELRADSWEKDWGK